MSFFTGVIAQSTLLTAGDPNQVMNGSLQPSARLFGPTLDRDVSVWSFCAPPPTGAYTNYDLFFSTMFGPTLLHLFAFSPYVSFPQPEIGWRTLPPARPFISSQELPDPLGWRSLSLSVAFNSNPVLSFSQAFKVAPRYEVLDCLFQPSSFLLLCL